MALKLTKQERAAIEAARGALAAALREAWERIDAEYTERSPKWKDSRAADAVEQLMARLDDAIDTVDNISLED